MKSGMMKNVAVCLALVACLGFGLAEAQANNCCQIAAGCGSGKYLTQTTCEGQGGAYFADAWCQTAFGSCAQKTGAVGEPELPVCEAIDQDACITLTLNINEVRIDQSGSDNDEYFELIGAPGTPLTGLTYVSIGDDSGDGSGDLGKRSGSIEAAVDLTGMVIPADGHFLAAEDGDTVGAAADLVASFSFENSDNLSHLLVRGFTGAIGDDLDVDNDCVLDGPAPWAEMIDAISLVETENPQDENFNECNYGFGGGVGPDGMFVPGQAYRCNPTGTWTIGAFSLGVTDTPGALNLACPVQINEVRIDQSGSDNDEYFELKGAPFTPLDGLTYVSIGDDSGDGSGDLGKRSGSIEAAVDLTGMVIPADGHFLAAEDGDTVGAVADLITSFSFENSDNLSHLLVRGFTGAIGDDLDADNDCVLDDGAPWVAMIDAISLVETENPQDENFNECNYGFGGGVGPDGNFVPAQAYRCETAGEWTIGEFSLGETDTPGALNLDCPVVISEIRIDQPGSDVDQYFELRGSAGASLDGLTYVVIGDDSGDGSGDFGKRSGVIEAVVDLTGSVIPADGHFLAVDDTFSLAGVPDLVLTPCPFPPVLGCLNFENSDNVSHLLVKGFTGALNDVLDTDRNGTLDIEPWDEIVDAISLVETENPPTTNFNEWDYGFGGGVGPDGNFVPGHVYRCVPEDDWVFGQFSPDGGQDTPGVSNNDCALVCGSPNAGSCFDENDTASCEDLECCETVCLEENDPSCCEGTWTQGCADIALVECRECGDPATGDCFSANGTPYCSVGACCDTVCATLPECCTQGWTELCAEAALANCDIPIPLCGDVVFGLDNADSALTLELVRGPAVAGGGAQADDFFVGDRPQSVEFDNLGGIPHNPQGNLLGVNFGAATITSYATCNPVAAPALIGDTVGLGGAGLSPTRIGGLSVSPNNDKIAVTGFDSGAVIIYDYTEGDCNGNGAALSGARQTADGFLCQILDEAGVFVDGDTIGTAWLNNNIVLAFDSSGQISAISAGDPSITEPVALVDTVTGCGPGFTDIDYNPEISPFVFAMYSSFTDATANLLFVLDPDNDFSLEGTFDYSASMQTSREIGFDSDGNLYISAFSSDIDVVAGGAALGALAAGPVLWYESTDAPAASFNGMDVARGCQACCLTSGCEDLDPNVCADQGGSAGGAGSACDEFCCSDADCDDEDSCTDDSCDEETGECSNTAVVCDDEDACTDDECVGGECVFTDVECGNCAVCVEGECVSTEQTLIIKQGASPAPLNPNGNGVTPILLVGTGGFNVNAVVQASLDLHICGAENSGVQPLADHTRFSDLNHPSAGSVDCGGCTDNANQSSDGTDDLSMKFRTDEVVNGLALISGAVTTLELSGTLLDGSPFCARDCVVVVPPGVGQSNLILSANVVDTFVEVTPLDLNVDSDGFANFSRSYFEGTAVTLTAPVSSEGQKFMRWSVNGVMQPLGTRTVEVVVTEDTTLKAFYRHQGRLVPGRPTADDGSID